MGQDQTKSSSSEGSTPSTPSSSINIPYTSFSVPKIQGASASSALRKLSILGTPKTPTIDQSQQKTQKSDDDIIAVVTLDGQQQQEAKVLDESYPGGGDGINDLIDNSRNNEKDDLLRDLKQLAEFYPLIRSKVEQKSSTLSNILKFNAKDYFGSSSSSNNNPNVFTDPSLKELDCIDAKPLVDICAEFQTNAMHQNRGVAFRQEEVLKLLSATCIKSNNTHKLLERKNAELQHVASELRDAERLNRYVEQSRKYVDLIILQVQELESLLPHSVRSTLDTPLFEKCSEPQFVETATTTITTSNEQQINVTSSEK